MLALALLQDPSEAMIQNLSFITIIVLAPFSLANGANFVIFVGRLLWITDKELYTELGWIQRSFYWIKSIFIEKEGNHNNHTFGTSPTVVDPSPIATLISFISEIWHTSTSFCCRSSTVSIHPVLPDDMEAACGNVSEYTSSFATISMLNPIMPPPTSTTSCCASRSAGTTGAATCTLQSTRERERERNAFEY